MPHAQAFPCTVSVDVSGFVAQGANRPEVVSALVQYFHPAPIAAIQFSGTDAKLTFEREVHKRDAMRNESISVILVHTRAIPRNLIIDGFPMKVSYVGQEFECDICGKKGHIAQNCKMRGKCMECKQPGHFQRNCPLRRQRFLRPDEDVDALPDVAGSFDGAGSLGNGQLDLDVVSGPSAGRSDCAGSSVAGNLNLPVGPSSVTLR